MNCQTFNKLALISSPAKIIITGQHAVVYGQDALAMAINLRSSATVSCKKCLPMEQNKLIFKGSLQYQLTLDKLDTNIDLSYNQYTLTKKSQTNYHEQHHKINYKLSLFIQQTHTVFPSNHHYLIQIHSDIPIGKGLGSSASFNTILATSLFIITTPNNQLSSINKQQINRISHLFQRIEHGTPSGIDNYLATFGGLVIYNNKKQPPFQSILDENISNKLQKLFRFRLVDSGVKKNTENAVRRVRQYYEKDQKYKQMIKQIGTFPQKIMTILKKADETKEQNSWKEQFLSIISSNHNYLRDLGVSIPEIEQIVQKNTVKGVKSAKLTGGGMGGYVLVVQCQQKVTQEHSPIQLITEMDKQGLIIEYI